MKKFSAAIALLLLALPVEAQVSGRVYPERCDDLSWENELVAFRVYGPETQRRGERSYGYDLFLKYPDKGPVLERLYGEQCSAANWSVVDSLRKIDARLAKDFENSFTYHIDHGLGMDCYAVGSTLGCGVAALRVDGAICYPWCYETVDIKENGPDRFEAALTFAPVKIGDDEVIEKRTISLEKGSRLNHCEVCFEGLTEPRELVVGFPMRGTPQEYADVAKGIIAITDPTQGADNGTIFLGVDVSNKCTGTVIADNHFLLTLQINPGETLVYDWGFAWDRTDISDFRDWVEYLCNRAGAQD
ncbi:MAG: DUF4861 domain-containing protein [Muribaculaceae bacterium]|nr:DUF4861 domain-containing protein [Muribaculaceae bacterium]